MRLLTSQTMVCGLPKLDEPHYGLYERCALGKHLRIKFPRGEAWRAYHPLQLVHSEIYGPMQAQSLGKIYYFLTFINDFSRFCWIYFLKSKDEAFSYFQDFKSHVEN